MQEASYGRPLAQLKLERSDDFPPPPDAVPADTVLVTAMGAPIPEQLATVPTTVGSLYARLAPLAREVASERPVADQTGVDAPAAAVSDLVITFLSGAELESLAGAWIHLVKRPNVRVLHGLPGQLEDPLFAHAAKAIGLKEVDWVDVEGQLARQARSAQSAADSDPSRERRLPGDVELVTGDGGDSDADVVDARGPAVRRGPTLPRRLQVEADSSEGGN